MKRMNHQTLVMLLLCASLAHVLSVQVRAGGYDPALEDTPEFEKSPKTEQAENVVWSFEDELDDFETQKELDEAFRHASRKANPKQRQQLQALYNKKKKELGKAAYTADVQAQYTPEGELVTSTKLGREGKRTKTEFEMDEEGGIGLSWSFGSKKEESRRPSSGVSAGLSMPSMSRPSFPSSPSPFSSRPSIGSAATSALSGVNPMAALVAEVLKNVNLTVAEWNNMNVKQRENILIDEGIIDISADPDSRVGVSIAKAKINSRQLQKAVQAAEKAERTGKPTGNITIAQWQNMNADQRKNIIIDSGILKIRAAEGSEVVVNRGETEIESEQQQLVKQRR